MRRGERILFHEQRCAPSVSGRGFSRTSAPLESSGSIAARAPPMGQHPALHLIGEGIAAQKNAPVPAPVVAQAPTDRPASVPATVCWESQQSVAPAGVSRKSSYFDSFSLGGWADPRDQSETDSDCSRRERNLLPLPPLSVAEALAWHQCEGNVDLLTDYANFTNEGINHLYGSPGKRLRKNPSLSQQAVQHNISDKVERLYARLNEGNVTFDQKAALKLAQMDADDDPPPPAARLIASAFDIKKTVAQSTLCDVFQKSTRRPYAVVLSTRL